MVQMPMQEDYRKVAAKLRQQLGSKPFVTVARREVTDLLREVSGQPSTRIKVLVAGKIMDELAEVGLTTYPALYEAGTFDSIRVFRSDSFLVHIMELLNNPNDETDEELRAAIAGVEPVLAAPAST